MDDLDKIRLHRIALAASSLVVALELMRAPHGSLSVDDRNTSEASALAMMTELEEAIDLWRAIR